LVFHFCQNSKFIMDKTKDSELKQHHNHLNNYHIFIIPMTILYNENVFNYN